MSLMYVLVKNITKLIKDRKHATYHKFCFEKAKLNTNVLKRLVFALLLHTPMNTYQFC